MNDKSCGVIRLFYFTEDDVTEIEGPPLPKILDAVRSLDGIDIDTLSITLRSGDSMDVGGGKDNQYKCHARIRNDFYDLVNPDFSQELNEMVSIMMNEEVNTYPKYCIVTLDMVLQAIEYFSTYGQLSNDLTWDNTLDYEPL